MFPWVAALAGLVVLRCPHCGLEQARARRTDPVTCNHCGEAFSQEEGRQAARDGDQGPRPL